MRIEASSPRCCSEGNCPIYIFMRGSRGNVRCLLFDICWNMAKEEPVFRFFFHYLLLSVNDALKVLDLFSPIPTLLFGCIVGFLRVLIG